MVFDRWVANNKKLKRGLAACSLTCRYWAACVRPMLFESIVLRNGEDVERLLQLLCYSVPLGYPILQCIVRLGIKIESSSQQPWLHHVSRLCGYMNSAGCSVYLDLSVDNHAQERHDLLSSTALPFKCFPRSIPCSILPIYRITLDNLHLRRIGDLVRFIQGFPSLYACACRHVSFTDASYPSTIQLSPRQPSRMLTHITMSECGDGQLCTQLKLAATALLIPRVLGLDDRTWAIAFRAAILMSPSDHHEAAASLHGSDDDTESDCYLGTSERGQIDIDEAHVASAFRVHRAQGTALASISFWTLHLQGARADVVRCMDWERFQRTLLELDAVPVLVVRSSNADAFKWLLEAVTQDAILAPAKYSGRLELRWSSVALNEEIDVLAMRSQYTVAGTVIHLSPVQRFELILCKDDAADKEA